MSGTFNTIRMTMTDEDFTRLLELPNHHLHELSLMTNCCDLWNLLFDKLLEADNKPELIKKMLKTMKRFDYCEITPLHEVQSLSNRFLELIYSLDTRSEHSDIVVEFLLVFFISDSRKREILDFEYPQLKFIFESCQKQRIPLICQPGQCGFISDVTNPISLECRKILKDLLISGFNFDFSMDAFTIMKDFYLNRFNLRRPDDYNIFRRNLSRENHLQIIYRVMQTNQMYRINMFHSELELEDIRYLWLSIPDPFLIHRDFDDIYSGLEIWNWHDLCQEWYVNEFKLPADWMRQPRSLRHISRCAVRRRLAECFQLPNIESLPLPKSLHSYLSWTNLEDIY